MLVGYVDEIPVDPVLMRTKTVGKHLVKVVQLPEEIEARMRDCHYQSRYSKKLSQQRYQYRITIVPGPGLDSEFDNTEPRRIKKT